MWGTGALHAYLSGGLGHFLHADHAIAAARCSSYRLVSPARNATTAPRGPTAFRIAAVAKFMLSADESHYPPRRLASLYIACTAAHSSKSAKVSIFLVTVARCLERLRFLTCLSISSASGAFPFAFASARRRTAIAFGRVPASARLVARLLTSSAHAPILGIRRIHSACSTR